MKAVARQGALALALLVGGASAADLWGSVNVTFLGYGVSGGMRLLPFGGGASLGVEGGWQRPYRTTANEFSLGATVRGLRLPGTPVNAYLGGGATFEGWLRQLRPYGEAGLQLPLPGALSLLGGVRVFGGSGGVDLGLRAEWHYRY